MIRSHPQMYAREFETFKLFDGLIIEGGGLGHLPVIVSDELCPENEKISAVVKMLAKKIPVVMTSQTIFGRVNLNVYSYGIKLKECGVLGDNTDMLAETALVKLAWLLTNHKEKVKELIGQNLKGEISERSDTNFIE